MGSPLPINKSHQIFGQFGKGKTTWQREICFINWPIELMSESVTDSKVNERHHLLSLPVRVSAKAFIN